MDRTELKKELTLEEGERLTAYPDSEGILSVGIGHNCVDQPVPGVTKAGDRITPEMEQELFDRDVDEAVADLDRELPWWKALDDVRQNVLLDMCFNMGVNGLKTFVNTLAFIEAGDYTAAVRGMKQSKWARQVGSRSVRLGKMMETGEFQ